MKLVIEIELDSAAFEFNARTEALRAIGHALHDMPEDQSMCAGIDWAATIMDFNGGKVGRAEIVAD